MGFLTKFAKYGLLGLLVVAAAGAAYQRIASNSDRSTYPPPGDMVNLDGLAMHLDCRGTGEPTVILEAGLTFGSTSWALVHEQLSAQTRVCAYDRPGIDWSEPVDEVLSATSVVERLHQLLQTAQVEPPYVLVGMSAGGIFMREYYQRFPKGVEAMVLVDSSHEQQGNRLPKVDSMETMNQALALCRWIQPFGVVRFTGLLEQIVDRFQLPQEHKAALLANMNQTHSCLAMLNEGKGFGQEVLDPEPPTNLQQLPLLVLSQGAEPSGIPEIGLTDAMAQDQRVVWEQLQQELAQLSTRGQQVIAERSGHLIQFEQPELVIAEIQALVRNVQDELPHH